MAKLSQSKAEITWPEYTSVFAHDLVGKLAVISGYTELLLLGTIGPLNGKQEEILEIIKKNARESKELLDGFSTLAAIETEVVFKDPEGVNLAACIETAIATLQDKVISKNQVLVSNLPSLPPVLANEGRLVEIITCLLENAYKYTSDGGEISLTAENVAGFVKVTVVDTGVGITAAEREFIFKALQRGANAYVREQPGLGLGLALAKGLVEYFGGEIGFNSEPGKGSQFWFTIPVA